MSYFDLKKMSTTLVSRSRSGTQLVLSDFCLIVVPSPDRARRIHLLSNWQS